MLRFLKKRRQEKPENAGISGPAPRRRLQFSLRTLMIAVAVVSVGCSLYVVVHVPATKQRRAVEAIKRCRGSVTYDFQGRLGCEETGEYFYKMPHGWGREWAPDWVLAILESDYFVNVDSASVPDVEKLEFVRAFPKLKELGLDGAFTDADLSAMRGLPPLESLYLNPTSLSAEGLRTIASQNRIRRLYLHGRGVTNETLAGLDALEDLRVLTVYRSQADDSGLVHVGRCRRLKRLSLFETPVNGDGFDALARLEGLWTLNLARTRVTDESLKCLRRLPVLEWLILYDTDISDVGLINLESVTTLKRLDVRGSKVTRTGVATLQRSLPCCEICSDHRQ